MAPIELSFQQLRNAVPQLPAADRERLLHAIADVPDPTKARQRKRMSELLEKV